jgi:hypothetical protein
MNYPNGWRSAALLWVFALGTAAATDQPGQRLAISNSKAGVFEVISHRMQAVGAGAVLGGLIGAAIESGMESSQDEEMKKRLLKSFPDASCSQPLLDAFSARLRADGPFTLEDAKSKGGAAVDIAIDECGFHLADSTGSDFASYVYLTLKFKPAAAAAWSEKIQVSGRNRYGFEDLVNQAGLAQSELGDVLRRAGVRAADKIIYQKQ